MNFSTRLVLLSCSLVQADDNQCQVQLDQSQQQIQQLQMECNNQLGQLSNDNQEKTNQLQHLQAEISKCQSDFAESSNKVNQMQAEIEKCGNDLASAQANAENQRQEAQKTISALEGKVNQANDALANESAATKDTERNAETKLRELTEAAEFKTSKLTSDLEKLQKELDASQKSKQSLDKKLKQLEAELEDVTNSNVNIFSSYVSKAQTLSSLLYREVIQQEPFISLSLNADHFTDFQKTSTVLFKEAQTVGGQLFKTVSAASMEFYNEQGYPLYVLAQMETKNIYDQYLAEPMKPVWAQVRELEIEKMANEAYLHAKLAYRDASDLVSESVVPGVNLLYKSGSEMLNDFNLPGKDKILQQAFELRSQVDGPLQMVTQPITLNVLSEKVVFDNGACDIALFGLFIFVGLYVVVYRFLLTWVVWKFGIKFFAKGIVYKGLIRTSLFVTKFVVRLAWWCLATAFSLSLFIAKLAMCCGCCGTCFRSSSSGSKIVHKKAQKISSLKQPPMQQAKSKVQPAPVQNKSSQKKKK